MFKDTNNSKPFMTHGEITLNNVYNAGVLIAVRFILLLIVHLCLYNDGYLTKTQIHW